MAIGRWENKPVLAIRWNGGEENPLGNPQSRGTATWFIVPDQHWRQILESEPFKSTHTDILELARKFLEMKRAYFLSRCPNPSCRDYQGLVLHSFRPEQIKAALEELGRGEFKLYHVICDASWIPNPQDRAKLTATLKGAWEQYQMHSTRQDRSA